MVKTRQNDYSETSDSSTNELLKAVLEQNRSLQAAVTCLLQNANSSERQIDSSETLSSRTGRGVSGLCFEKFDETLETFETYLERLTAYLDVQNVPTSLRAKTLVSTLSPDKFTLLKSLLYPESYKDKTFDELKEVLTNHLHPRPLIIPSRYALFNRKQRERESLSVYLSELRKLASFCYYPENILSVVLRDVFVGGLRSKAILDRLFEEDDLPLEKTIQIANAMERANISSEQLLNSYGPVQSLSDVKMPSCNLIKTSANTFKGEVKKSYICYRCGGPHSARDCKQKGLKCTFCKRKNHVEAVCRLKKNGFKANRISQTDSESQYRPSSHQTSTDELYYEDVEQAIPMPLRQVETTAGNFQECENFRRPILIDVKIDGVFTKMEMDTGAVYSVMGLENFRKISNAKYEPTSVIFKSYSQETVKPLGVAWVTVQYQDCRKRLKLFIVENNLPTILGRDWIFKLDIKLPLVYSLNLDSQGTSGKLEEEVARLLDQYRGVFDENLGEIRDYTCEIHVKPGTKPIFKKARPVPFALRPKVEEEIAQLEKAKVITKISFSDWATPVVPVVKPNGKIRLCADYSVTLNAHLNVTQYPLPKTEELFAKLNGGEQFTRLDLSTAYLHMRVTDESSKLLTINTHKGLYKCNRLMFGVSSAPAEWQKYMDSLLGDIPGVCVFFDDIAITGKTRKEHIDRLKQVLEKLSKSNLRVNKAKSEFFQKEMVYLGFKIDKRGVHTTSDKVKALLEIPRPKCVKEIKAFLGMVTFYGRFFPNLSTVAYPLNELTKKDVPFNWDQKCEEAFLKIKTELTSSKILAHYDPTLPLILAVDASPVGMGAVLSHQYRDGRERPIAYASKTLTSTQQKYSQIDKEALAIRWGVEKFFHYLYGQRFILFTDHQPLVHIFGNKAGLPCLSAARLLRYAMYLQGFQFDIRYRKTDHHGNADCMSRFPLKSEALYKQDDLGLYLISQMDILPITPIEVASETQRDPEMKRLYQELKEGGRPSSYTLESGCIFQGTRLYVPPKFRESILKELHLGHIGVVKMKGLARSVVYWPGIDKEIERMARSCLSCLEIQRNPAKCEVHHWEYPSKPWERIYIDFAGPFCGFTFLVVADAFSKWMEVFIVSSTSTLATIGKLKELFARYGFPEILVSDNAATFTSQEFAEYLKKFQIRHITCAPFHPSSNGQAERCVGSLKQTLKSLKDAPGSMSDKLNTFLLAYRRAPNMTTGESPAQLFLNRNIRTNLTSLRPDLKATVRYKQYRDKLCIVDREFEVGERVAVRQYNRPNQKWSIGRIVSRDGQLHYTVEVEGTLQRRHVDQLQKTEQLCPANDSNENSENHRSQNFPETTNPVELRRSQRVRRPPVRYP